MRSGAFIVGGACVAVALGGCSLSKTSSGSTAGFTGQKALIASTINLFASDANSADGSDICKNVLASNVRGTLNKVGNCTKIINNQLKTIDDFTLKIETIKVSGKSALASVQTVDYGKKVISKLTLTDQTAGWRISQSSAL